MSKEQCETIHLASLEILRRTGVRVYHEGALSLLRQTDAVVADDFDQGISEIVRGIDLMDSTPRQIHLQQQLGMTTPHYLHIPVATNEDGQKLSKLTGAQAISADSAGETLVAALQALQQAQAQAQSRATLLRQRGLPEGA